MNVNLLPIDILTKKIEALLNQGKTIEMKKYDLFVATLSETLVNKFVNL